MSIELTDEQQKIIDICLDPNAPNCMAIGRAGVGKSTTLRAITSAAKEKNLHGFVCAPTGIAAINCGGVTIHNFIRTLFTVSGDGRRKIDYVLLDEVSMCRCDLMDELDKALRFYTDNKKVTFGGIKIILLGDCGQLPPVLNEKDGGEVEYITDNYLTKFFFSSKAYSECQWTVVELTKIFRQKDPRFIKLLNLVRAGETDIPLQVLNDHLQTTTVKGVFLTGTNAAADAANLEMLASIDAPEVLVVGGKSGTFYDNELPTMYSLPLKVGAKVMVIKNIYGDMGELELVNGDVGEIIEFRYEVNEEGNETEDVAEIYINCVRTGREHSIGKTAWEKHETGYDRVQKQLTKTLIGSFVQFPLRLAYAVTIHKSQGSTIEELTVDLRRPMFCDGQLYVALSRGVSLDKLHILGKCRKTDIRTAPEVTAFLSDFKSGVGVKPGGRFDAEIAKNLFAAQISSTQKLLKPLPPRDILGQV